MSDCLASPLQRHSPEETRRAAVASCFEEIRDFLDDRKGTEPFNHTLPSEVIAKAYTCSEWQTTALQTDLFSINAVFRQWFGAAS